MAQENIYEKMDPRGSAQGTPVPVSSLQPIIGVPVEPPKPEKPEETFRFATEAEKIAERLDPKRAYQISNTTGKFVEVAGQPTARTTAVNPNRPFQINSALDAIQNIKKLAERSLSVGKTAGAVGDIPVIGSFLGQNRADLEGALNLVNSNLIQDQMAFLSQLNPQGMASLANTQAEAERLASSIANLDPNQSRDAFFLGLQRAEDYYKRQLQDIGAERKSAVQVDEQGREIVPVQLRVAQGEEFATEADFKRRQDSAEAWAKTQGLPFDQALTQFNTEMAAKGYGEATPQTIEVLQWYEQNRPGNRGAVKWELPSTGVRESEAPGAAAAAASGLLTGSTAGLLEEAVGMFDPEAAAKLEAAKQYGREQYAGTTLAGEVIGGLLSPLSRIGPGGTVAREAMRGGAYGGLYGFGEASPETGFMERLPSAAIGAVTGGAGGALAQRLFGGAVPAAVADEIPPVGGVAPEMPPVGAMAPEIPAAPMQPAAAPVAAPMVAPVAEEAVTEVAEMTPQEIGDLARKAIGRTPGAAKAKSQLASLAKANPEAVAAADRLGLELPIDVLSDNAQLRSLTGLTRSEVGSEAETAWGEASRAVVQRAQEALDELGGTTDIAQVSADVFKRVDDAQEALGKQAGRLRDEVEETFNVSQRVEPTAVKNWLQSRIDELGGGKEGLAALSPEEKRLWGVVSKGQPTYALINETRDMIGQALGKGTGPWANSNLARVKKLYGALAEDQINFIEATAGKEIADKQRAANTLFQEMFKGREQMQDIFGKDLSKSLAPLMQRAITSGAKGDISALNQLISSVPEDMRGTVLTSALFNASKTRSGARGEGEKFSFTNFSKIYGDLRDNKEVYKQVAKSVGPEGDQLLIDLYAISRRMADAENKVLKTGKANQVREQLNAEGLVSRITKGAAGRLGAYTLGGIAAGPVGAAAVGGLAEGAQYVGKNLGKDNFDKVHKLLSSDEFRSLMVSTVNGEAVERNINRVASSRPFIAYLKSIGAPVKDGKAWLRAALTVAPVSGLTRQEQSAEPMAMPSIQVQQ